MVERAERKREDPPPTLSKNVFALAVSAMLAANISLPCRAAELVLESSKPLPWLTRLFRRNTGWTGADSAYSVKLSADRTLWLFGDTWIGRIANGNRRDSVMVNNTAAWQSLRAPRKPLQFFWGKKDGKPASLLTPEDPGTYYWPGDGAVVDGNLYLFMHVIRPKPDNPPPFQFESVATDLLQIQNPQAPPPEWRFQRARITAPDCANFGIACLLDDQYLYAYSSYPPLARGTNAHPTILSRIERTALSGMDMSAWEHLVRPDPQSSPAWRPALANPLVLINDGAPEMSVCRVPGIDGLVAFYIPPFSSDILVRHAHRPEGPWSRPLQVYTCPDKERGLFVYTAKGHPELSAGAGELPITYCRNTEEFALHITRPRIYSPRGVLVRLRSQSDSSRPSAP